MSTRTPWVIAPDAARALTILATPEQVQQAAGDPIVAPADIPPAPARLVSVHFAGLTRTGWVTAPADPPRPGHPGPYQVHLVPQLSVESFRTEFTTCGFGWAISEGPVGADERVEVVDTRDGPFMADAEGDSRPYGRWWRTLLHVDHGEQADLPVTMTATVPPGAEHVDVPIDEIVGWRTLQVGHDVELLGARGVRYGTALQVAVHDGLPCYTIAMADAGMDRTDPTVGWIRPAPPRPRLTPDRMEVFVTFTDPHDGGWPADGAVTTHVGDRHLPEEPLGEAALRAAVDAWRHAFAGSLTPGQQEAVLRLAVLREADDRKVRVDWQAARTWIEEAEDGYQVAHGEFPLLRPLAARTPGSPT